jgi:hypothetical protein
MFILPANPRVPTHHVPASMCPVCQKRTVPNIPLNKKYFLKKRKKESLYFLFLKKHVRRIQNTAKSDQKTFAVFTSVS